MKNLSDLLSWYRSNLKTWRNFKRCNPVIHDSGRWPSETYCKYPPTYNFGGKSVLNFGCGKSTYAAPNVVNLDVVEGPGINVVCKTNIMPFADDTFDHIIANHVLEHVPNWFETFKEMARVVKPGGIVEVWIPPTSSDSAFTYRDHINRIGLVSFAGCASMPNSGHNALAEHEFKEVGQVSRLHLIQMGKRPIIKWWTMLAWPSLLAWLTEYLRNTVSEENYMFRKV